MKAALDQLFQLHQAALGVRASRGQVLASNIANADTPGYQARDLDFRSALQAAIGASSPGGAPALGYLVRTSNRHLQAEPSSGLGNAGASLVYRTVTQASIDNNTVDVNVERAQFADNAMRYEASLTFLNGKIKSLLTAMQS